MLALSLASARARLLHSPGAASSATRCCKLNNQASSVASHYSHRMPQPLRVVFSTCDGSRIDGQHSIQEKSEESNGKMSALERLLHSSQHFRLDEEDDHDVAFEATKEKEDNESVVSKWQLESRSRPKHPRSSRYSFAPKRNTFHGRGNVDRHWQLGRKARSHIISKEMDEIDYENELENVWDEQELKRRKFHQALRREQDKNHVCTNCGERGHRPRNCLVPPICSNCGNLGHTAHQCRRKKLPDSIDEFLIQEKALELKRKKNHTLRQRAAEAAKNPDLPRPIEVPTSDFNKRNESLRKELDAELDAYADKLEKKARKRKELATQKVD